MLQKFAIDEEEIHRFKTWYQSKIDQIIKEKDDVISSKENDIKQHQVYTNLLTSKQSWKVQELQRNNVKKKIFKLYYVCILKIILKIKKDCKICIFFFFYSESLLLCFADIIKYNLI